MPMIIRENLPLPFYRQPMPRINTLPNIPSGVRQLPPRVAIGGGMIIRVHNSRSGCSSCGK